MTSKRLRIGPLELRLHWIPVLFVLLLVGLFVRLGIWQLERAEEKIARQTEQQSQAEESIRHIRNLPLAGRPYDRRQLQNQRVRLTGHFINERDIFLIYQSHEDQVGYEVVTPFAVNDYDEVVMVSRGWVGAASYETLAEKVPAVEGDVTIEGRIYVPSESEASRENPPHEIRWPLLRRHLRIDQLGSHFNQPLFPYVLRLDEGQPGVFIRHWPTVTADTQQHFSYALQWFAMGIAVVLVALILSSNLLTLIRQRLRPL